jgi:hypothetical protein
MVTLEMAGGRGLLFDIRYWLLRRLLYAPTHEPEDTQ